jgi:hypothetical protein
MWKNTQNLLSHEAESFGPEGRQKSVWQCNAEKVE